MASFLSVSLLFITASTADGFYHVYMSRCLFNSTELNDIELINSYYFNKLEFLRFDSNVGEFVGYTELGMKQAAFWNSDKAYLDWVGASKKSFCFNNVNIVYKAALTKSVKPTVRLHSTTPLSGHHPAMLVCSVFNFYPKLIRVSWTRDGQMVTSDVSYTEVMADGDWYYQAHSHLEYTPRSGEKITCVVEHSSLKQPLDIDWDPSMPESERNQLAIGASGLILGLILSLAGFIYYKRKARGHILVPTN